MNVQLLGYIAQQIKINEEIVIEAREAKERKKIIKNV